MALHCSITHNPIDAWVVSETDPGGSLASPRWRFCGFDSMLESNETVEMTLSASGLKGPNMARGGVNSLFKKLQIN